MYESNDSPSCNTGGRQQVQVWGQDLPSLHSPAWEWYHFKTHPFPSLLAQLSNRHGSKNSVLHPKIFLKFQLFETSTKLFLYYSYILSLCPINVVILSTCFRSNINYLTTFPLPVVNVSRHGRYSIWVLFFLSLLLFLGQSLVGHRTPKPVSQAFITMSISHQLHLLGSHLCSTPIGEKPKF